MLLHPSIDLDDDAGEHDFLTLGTVELRDDFWVGSASAVILELGDWLRFHARNYKSDIKLQIS